MPFLDTQHTLIEELKWKHFNVGPHGFVCLANAMGSDAELAAAARCSYKEGTKTVSDDTQLIRYLLRHEHGTPLEMASIKLLIKAPLFVIQQWLRHRIGSSFNQESHRYSEASDDMFVVAPDEWRSQSGTNKQGSDGFLSANEANWDYFSGQQLSDNQRNAQDIIRTDYQFRINSGVSREQARVDLPVSTYSVFYWQVNTRSLIHFLGLRMDTHAQQEIREYAETICTNIFEPLFPETCQAFYDYVLNSVRMTALDIQMIQHVTGYPSDPVGAFEWACENMPPFTKYGWQKKRCRERDECRAKLVRFGVLPEKGGE